MVAWEKRGENGGKCPGESGGLELINEAGKPAGHGQGRVDGVFRFGCHLNQDDH